MAARSTEETDEDLHCDALARDWMAYLFNGMFKIGAQTPTSRAWS
jgi:hypothetical protein